MKLAEYKKKRNFKRTPEPKGRVKKSGRKNLYLIQKHAASHLHYDLRLELNGVLKSWAVPKGPCLDPTVKRLAVHVEDHPIEYGSFQGIIPQGQYGGGTVMLWDTGQWECLNASPEQAYKKGHLSFLLHGKKLQGQWTLVRSKDEKNWFFFKAKDKFAKPLAKGDICLEKPNSVLNNKTMDEISAGNKVYAKTKKSAKSSSSRKVTQKFPEHVSPTLCTLVTVPPQGKQWLHEIKLDGYRILSYIKNNKVKLLTRTGLDWSSKFPAIVKALSALKLGTVILDGEIVAQNATGHSDFQLLQNNLKSKDTSQLIYYVFDILYHEKNNLLNTPLLERKKILSQLLGATHAGAIRYHDHIIGAGDEVFENACQLGLEGIVSKKIASVYSQVRSKEWLKIKCHRRQEFILCGYTKPQGARKFFGSILLGIYKNEQLTYCGHVGTGFTSQTLNELFTVFQKYKTKTMPFSTLPPMHKGVTWLKPMLVAEIEFTEWTATDYLRHPSFKGLRKDKQPEEVKKEMPKALHSKSKVSATKTEPKKFSQLTHPDKILYPEQNITKQQVAEYYLQVQDWILPYLRMRPLSLLRCPGGRTAACFYQKHINEKNENLFKISIRSKQESSEYSYLNDINGLLALVQMGVLEIHPWNCQVKNIAKPDMLVFDIDPAEDVQWRRVIKAALLIHDELEELSLQSFVRTSGGKGLHVVVPIKPLLGWEAIKTFCHGFVKMLEAKNPTEYVSTITKSKRVGKIFIDYLRNQQGATAIANYSTRARENAPVATPLSWDELTTKIKSDTYTIKNLPKRLAKLDKDPWEDFFKIKQVIKSKFLKSFLIKK